MTWTKTPAAAAAILAVAGAIAACGSTSSPSSPSSSSITAPTADSPSDGAAASSYRPTLTVKNGSASVAGDHKYEFVISDSSSFASTTVTTGSFVVTVH